MIIFGKVMTTEINLDKIVEYILPISIAGDYNINLSIIGLLPYIGIGNWNGQFNIHNILYLNSQTLIGGGDYTSDIYNNTINLKVILTIKRKETVTIQMSELSQITNNWIGNASLTAGRLHGFLKNNDNEIEYPKLYELTGTYNRRCQKNKCNSSLTSILNVTNLKIS
jgi:hypothetical protein